MKTHGFWPFLKENAPKTYLGDIFSFSKKSRCESRYTFMVGKISDPSKVMPTYRRPLHDLTRSPKCVISYLKYARVAVYSCRTDDNRAAMSVSVCVSCQNSTRLS